MTRRPRVFYSHSCIPRDVEYVLLPCFLDCSLLGAGMSSYFYVLIPGMIQYKVRRHSFSTFVSSSAVAAGLFSRSRPRSTQGGCTHAMHDRSRMTIPAMSGWSTSGVHRPGRYCLHQAQSAVRCWASRMKGELHPPKTRFGGGLPCEWMTASN